MAPVIALMLLCLSSRNFACRRVDLDELADLTDDVALEASNDVSFASTFGGSAGDVCFRLLVVLHAQDHCALDGRLELAVSAVIDAVLAGGHP